MDGADVVRRLAERPGTLVRETHGSWVVLAGDRALKVKKPVRFAFMDLSTLPLRRAAGREEVCANAALAPGIYLGLRSALVRDGELVLGEEDDPGAIEYVVEMRRFDEGATLGARLAAGTVGQADVAAVAARVARFHAAAEAVEPDDPVGTLRERIVGDLDELEAADAPRPMAALRTVAEAMLAREGGLIARRAADGLVRDGHGDLRAEHVLLSEGLPIVDRLEFDPHLRVADVADDLAFLAMDLEALGARWAADALLDSYERAGGARAPAPLAAAFAWRRALVRAKVALLRHEREQARALLELADRLAWRSRGAGVVVVCGPPASGKSTLAAALAERLELPVLASDRVRKELLGLAATARAGEASYLRDVTERTYAQLHARAASLLREGVPGVIVDATYREAAQRRALEDAVGEAAWIWCDVPVALLRQRAARRLDDPRRVSDAGPEVAARLAAGFEPLCGGHVLRVGADDDAPAAVGAWLDEISRSGRRTRAAPRARR